MEHLAEFVFSKKNSQYVSNRRSEKCWLNGLLSGKIGLKCEKLFFGYHEVLQNVLAEWF